MRTHRTCENGIAPKIQKQFWNLHEYCILSTFEHGYGINTEKKAQNRTTFVKFFKPPHEEWRPFHMATTRKEAQLFNFASWKNKTIKNNTFSKQKIFMEGETLSDWQFCKEKM